MPTSATLLSVQATTPAEASSQVTVCYLPLGFEGELGSRSVGDRRGAHALPHARAGGATGDTARGAGVVLRRVERPARRLADLRAAPGGGWRPPLGRRHEAPDLLDVRRPRADDGRAA